MIRNVIFDLDGTLLDTSKGILESTEYAVKAMGFSELSHTEALSFIGPPLPVSFMRVYGCNEDTAMKATNYFREYYKDYGLLKARPYDGIYDLCRLLRDNGIKTAAATYKKEDYAVKLLKHFRFDEYFCSMHGADSEGVLTKAQIINICLAEMGGTKDDSVLIGDTEHDAKGADGAGIYFIGVTYGFGFASKDDVNRYKNIGTANSPLDAGKIILTAPQS